MGRGGERDGGGTYQVAYQNVGHLMSTWWTVSVSGLPSFASAWGGKANGVLVRRRAARIRAKRGDDLILTEDPGTSGMVRYGFASDSVESGV